MTAERRLTISLVGLIALIGLCGTIYLTAVGRDGGAVLAVATAALGILAPSPLSKSAVPDR